MKKKIRSVIQDDKINYYQRRERSTDSVKDGYIQVETIYPETVDNNINVTGSTSA